MGVVKFLVFALGGCEVLLDLLIDNFLSCDELFSGGILGLFVGDCDLDGAAGIETVVREEWGHQGRSMLSIVVREFRERKELEPVVLLIVAEDSKKLFPDLIDSIRLPV
jgi:hypothetical protein